jgi:hypothetical protein
MAKTKKASRKPKPSNVVASAAVAADRLGFAERTLMGWLARGCPGKPGAYDVDAIAAWHAANVRPRAQNTERSHWEARRSRAAALAAEMDLLLKRGKLIETERAAQTMTQHIAEVNAHLDQLPDFAVAGENVPVESKRKIRDKLRRKIHDMRLSLERSSRELAREAKRDGRATAEAMEGTALS